MLKVLSFFYKTVKAVFIVFLVYLGSLFFREQRLPGVWGERAFERYVSTNFIFHCDSLAFGFRRGFTVRELRLYDPEKANAIEPMVAAKSISIDFIRRRIFAVDVRYPRLPENYYLPGNEERRESLDASFPSVPMFHVTALRPAILGVTPERVAFDFVASRKRLDFKDIRLDWKDRDRRMSLDGLCWLDLYAQRLYGEVRGLTTQAHIRPLLVALDVPVSLPYMDAFTEVTEPVPAFCSWDVNLENNDFRLKLDLHPILGKYNAVPLRKADGLLDIRTFVRGTNLNYRTQVGPIHVEDPKGRIFDGQVVFTGTNGMVKVDAEAFSELPLTETLRIVGFEDFDLGDRHGKTRADICLEFPMNFTDFAFMNGRGKLVVRDGNIAQMRLFAGLTELLADKVPGVATVVNQSQASCAFTIEDGIVKSDDILIEGGVFSLKMHGRYSIPADDLNFVVRVQFLKEESILGKLVHPVTWPFTKLLLEFRLRGSIDDPKWEYVSMLDRIIEVVK